MKKSKLNSGLFLKKETLFLLLVSVIFLFTRFYMLERRVGFAADQEHLAFRAQELLNGNPVLLGPITSFSGFSVAPLFTYLWTAFSFVLRGDPVSGYFAGVFVALISNILIFFTAKSIFGRNVHYFASLIYLFSFTIYSWDISAWNPSLFYISHILVILGALESLKKQRGYLFLGLGIAIGVSSHITFYLTLIPVLLYWFLYHPVKPQVTTFVYSAFIAIAGILPVFIFDLTHRFENFLRLIKNTSDLYPEHIADLQKILVTFLKTCSGIVFPSVSIKTAVTFFILVLGISIYYMKKKFDKNIIFLGFSSIIAPIIFLFWKGNFSEYYLMATTIPFLFILANSVDNIFQKSKIIIFLFAGYFIFINFRSWEKMVTPINLWAMKKAVLHAVSLGGKEGYGVSLTTELGYNFGYKYIFDYYHSKPDLPPKKDQKKIVTIVVPPGFEGVNAKVQYDGIGVLWEGFDFK